MFADVDERVEFPGDLLLLHRNRADFDYPITVYRRKAGGLYVEHHISLLRHRPPAVFSRAGNGFVLIHKNPLTPMNSLIQRSRRMKDFGIKNFRLSYDGGVMFRKTLVQIAGKSKRGVLIVRCRVLRVDLDDPLLNGESDERRAGMEVDLFGEVRLVRHGGLHADTEDVGDLFMSVALCDELQHLLLPVRKGIVGVFDGLALLRAHVPVHHARGDGGMDVDLAGGHRLERRNKVGAYGLLEEVARDACLEEALDVNRVLILGEHEDLRLGIDLPDLQVASSPPSFGMEMSMSTMSGLCFLKPSMASTPSAASPTTSNSSAMPRNAAMPSRTRAWSSAMSIRILSGMPGLRGKGNGAQDHGPRAGR